MKRYSNLQNGHVYVVSQAIYREVAEYSSLNRPSVYMNEEDAKEAYEDAIKDGRILYNDSYGDTLETRLVRTVDGNDWIIEVRMTKHPILVELEAE